MPITSIRLCCVMGLWTKIVVKMFATWSIATCSGNNATKSPNHETPEEAITAKLAHMLPFN